MPRIKRTGGCSSGSGEQRTEKKENERNHMNRRKSAARKKFQQKRDELTDTTVKSLECAIQDQATAPTTRALTHAVRIQYLAKHKGEDRATSVSSNMQTLIVQADKECLDWIRGIIVEEIEKTNSLRGFQPSGDRRPPRVQEGQETGVWPEVESIKQRKM